MHYASPRMLRDALRAHHYDWTQVLSPAQLDIPLPADQWDGHTTLRAWLREGASTPEGVVNASRAVFAVIAERHDIP